MTEEGGQSPGSQPGPGEAERSGLPRAALAAELRTFAAELASAEAQAVREREARVDAMVGERLAAAERRLNATVNARLDTAVRELARDRRLLVADWGDRAARAAEMEARVELTLSRLLQGVLRIDGWMTAIAASERRILDAHARLASVERSVAEWAGVAQRAADWEGRMRRASAAEEDAARRIVEAELRLRDRLD